MSHTLLIQLDKNLPDEIKDYYKGLTEEFNDEDSGIDLVCPYELSINVFQVGTMDLGIKCAMINNSTKKLTGYYLYPRSSISKTPLMLANHVGIIDMGYRGNLMAKIRCLPYDIVPFHDNYIKCNSKNFKVRFFSRLFQICSPDLSPIFVKLVDQLPESKRGSGGFGSTGTSGLKKSY
jgi:dUTP pyrophosphatase